MLRERYGALAGGCAVGLAISWNLTNTGALASLLGGHYGVGLGAVGLLTAVAFLAELVVMLPGGWAIDRFGAKRVLLVALALVIAGNVALIVLPGFAAALVLRWVVGLGVGAGFIAGAVYAQLPGSRASGALAQGIYGGVSLSGAGLALGIVPALEGWLGWHAPYTTGLAVAVLALLVLAPCPPSVGAAREARVALRGVLTDRRIAGLGIVHAASFGFSVIIGNWIVTLLERNAGMERGAAGAVGALALILGVVGRPAGGWLVRHRPGETFRLLAASMVVGGVATALLAAQLAVAVDVLAAALAGLAAGIPFGSVVSGATQAYPRAPGTAVGAVNLFPVTTIVAGAPLLGLAFGLPGDGRIGFGVLAVLWPAAILVLPAALGARR